MRICLEYLHVKWPKLIYLLLISGPKFNFRFLQWSLRTVIKKLAKNKGHLVNIKHFPVSASGEKRFCPQPSFRDIRK